VVVVLWWWLRGFGLRFHVFGEDYWVFRKVGLWLRRYQSCYGLDSFKSVWGLMVGLWLRVTP
jgi:hypothetical protein